MLEKLKYPIGQPAIPKNIGIYAWHCNHHFAHIYNLMETKQWL
jgi:hypothetical protein